MPKIPQYSSQRLPTVHRDQYAGVQGRAAQEGAQVLKSTIEYLDKNRRLTQHNQGQARFLEGLDELEQRYSQDTDYFTLEQRLEKDLGDLKKRVLKETPDPLVAEQLDLSFGEQGIKFMGAMRSYARKGQAAAGRAATMAAIEQLKKSYLRAAPQDKEYWRGRIDETLAGMVASGQAWPDDVEEISQKLDYELSRAQVFADMDREGPQAALERLGRGDYDLPPEITFELEREIRREADRQEEEAKIRAAGGYEATDPDVEGRVATAILHSQGPQITKEELQQLHGRGLNTDDFNKYSALLDTEIKKEGGIEQYTLSQIYREIEGMYPGDQKGASKAKLRVLEAVEAEKKKEEALAERAIPPERIRAIAKDVLAAEKEGAVKKILNTVLAGPLGQWGLEVMGVNTPPEKEAKDTFSELPPAQDYPGQIIRDTTTGVRYRSNGTEWAEVK